MVNKKGLAFYQDLLTLSQSASLAGGIDSLTTNLRVIEYEPTNQAITKQLPVHAP